MSTKGKPETINDYINSAPEKARARLLEMHASAKPLLKLGKVWKKK